MPVLLHVVAAGAVDGTSTTADNASRTAAVFDMTRVSRPTTNVVWRGTPLPGTVRSGGVPRSSGIPPEPGPGIDRLAADDGEPRLVWWPGLFRCGAYCRW